MKKSELTQLTQIIEQLVRREIKRQLPGIIAETFQNMMGKPQQTIVEHVQPVHEDIVGEEEDVVLPSEDPSAFKTSLRELFAGSPPVRRAAAPPARAPRLFTKDPRINAVLNETVSDLRSRESMVGMAAFQGGYNPSGVGAAPMMEAPTNEMEPSFMRNTPSIPISRPPVLVEGQESNHAPLAEVLPQGVSALDIAREIPLAEPVAQALTKNYSQMMKLIDQKQGRK